MYGDKMFRGVGYPTPLSVPVERACRSALIPADAAWFGLFMGALEVLTDPANWQQFEGGISREEAACYFQEIVDSLYASAEGEGECVSDCCPQFRRNPATSLPEVSYDDGLTWDYFPDGPYEGADGPPIASPPPALDKGSDTADRCFAAFNATDVIAQFYQQTVGQVAASLFNSILSVNQFLYQINQTLFRFIYPTEAQIAQAVGLFNFDWGTYATAPTLDSDAIDALRCLLYENSSETDGIVSFDYGAIDAQVVGQLGTNPGVAVQLLLGYMQEPGLNYAGGVQVNSSADCSECGTFTHVFDFAVNDGGFTVDVGGSYTGSYWQSTSAGSGERLSIIRNFSSTEITSIEVQGLAGNVAGGGTRGIFTPVGNTGLPSGAGTFDTTYSPNAIINTFELTCDTVTGHTKNRFTKVIVTGVGTDPF